MIGFTDKLAGTATSIFTTMSALAQQYSAINLSQGFPDFDCSDRLQSLVDKHIRAGHNQYAPMAGLLYLREQIAAKVQDLHRAVYQPDTEITITSGATQAIFTAIATVIRPGDEVIYFEPAYDCYAPAVRLFGGIPRAVTLTTPDFRIPWEEVGSMITPQTRLIIVNTPNNPSAKMLHADDMTQLALLTRNTDILVISDEVYEHITYDGLSHQSVSRFNDLRERSFVVASFGKLYHNTGWKIGYCLAPYFLTKAFRSIHQYLVFSVNTPMQHALAEFLNDKDEYLRLGAFFQEKRDFFAAGLQASAFSVLPSEGTYFLVADYAAISGSDDLSFCRELTETRGVAAIPLSSFYSTPPSQNLIRFCFAKKTETLEKALEKLTRIPAIC